MGADTIIENRFPQDFKGFAAFSDRISGREFVGITSWQHGG
jgi:hypothetical protein